MPEETRLIMLRRFSWQAWLALAYVMLLYPLVWGNSSTRLHPGLQALLASGSRWGWYSFWGTVFVVEWTGFFLCLWALKSEGRTAREIGLYSPRLKLYYLLFGLAIVGFSAVFIAKGLDWLPSHPSNPHSLLSFTSEPELFFWLAMSITGGVCEETMFRGFAITYLRKLVGSTWVAVLLATLAFAYMHGGLHQGMFLFTMRFAIGLVFAGIYLWRDSLLPPMLFHFLIDAVTAL